MRGAMKSLRILMNEKSLKLGIRTSEENFGSLDNGNIQIIPMYFIGEYERVIQCFITRAKSATFATFLR